VGRRRVYRCVNRDRRRLTSCPIFDLTVSERGSGQVGGSVYATRERRDG
jgi:hypothetical protein